MRYQISKDTMFPVVELQMQQGEKLRLERGCMVYHNGAVQLEGKMNSNGAGGLGGALKAIGRSVTSNESFFITTATALAPNAVLGIAPGCPGQVRELQLGAQQWRLNDGAFLACDESVSYNMVRQSIGKAFFGGTGGLFVMETAGSGSMLINSYGDLLEFQVEPGRPFVADNTHVVAWTAGLNYELRVASGTFGFKTGEGLVNEFNGSGTVLLQSRNVKSLAEMVSRYIPSGG